MMVLVMHIEEDDTVLHIEKTGMLMLVVEIDVGGITADVVDKLTCSSDDVQPKQVDLRRESIQELRVYLKLFQFHIIDIHIGHRQEEWIDYDEVFAPMARIKAIRIFLAFASYMGFIFYQMDVKSAFLYGKIDEEVYVSQPLGFIDPKFPNKVYKVVKAQYGLHQAPRAWYATLSTFLKSWCDEFEALMKNKFQMSSMGELIFFLRLQVKKKEDGIFISQDKYVAEILKKFDFRSVKTVSTHIETKKPLVKDEEAVNVDVHLYRSMISSLMYLTASRPYIMYAACACSRFQVTPKTLHLQAVKRIFRYLKGQPILRLWYPRESAFDLEAYSDSDYAGANLDRKSTTGGCQFLGRRLILWQCKKQTIIATSTTEAEYVAAANCCRQVLWIQAEGEEKTEGNSEFHEIVDFLTSSTIHHALTLGEPFNDVYTAPAHTLKRVKVKEHLLNPNLHPLLLTLVHETNPLVLALETVKDAQAAGIIALKARIKKLEKKCKPSISHHRAWLMSVHRLSIKKRFGKKESISKQGRKKDKPTLDDSTLDDLDADHGIDIEEPMNRRRLCEETKELVSTTRPGDSIVRLDVGTADPIMKEDKAKEKGVSIKDIEDSLSPTRSILTLKPLPTIDPKDKGKGVLKEPEPAKKTTRSDLDAAQMAKDAEVARLVYEEESTELKREKEKRQREEEAFMAAIAEMYDKVQSEKGDDDFKPMDTDDAVNKEKVLEEPNNTKIEVKQEGDKENIKKRPGIRLKMKATKKSKRQKTDFDPKEEEHLKTFVQIVPDEEEEIDYEVLDKRFPIINWESKFYHLDRHGVEYDDLWKNQAEWIKSWNFYENCGVHTLTLKDGTEIYMLAERSAPCYCNEALAIPEQTTTSKETSNSFMAGSLPKTT
nr:putative ribonuclease H-like domain-containing protein [Tanacetum cinerariifolium]